MAAGSDSPRVHRLEFPVDWPPGHVAAYVVDGPEPVLVDAALPEHDHAFERALADVGLEPADLEHVLVTHPHVDHVGQVPTVLEAGDPTVYAPAGVRERFARDPGGLAERVRKNCAAAGIPEAWRDEAVEMAVDSLERNARLLPPASVDVWVEPGEGLAVGDLSVEAIHVPGHQADHLGYLTDVDGEAALLAGDMGIRPFRPVVLHDGLDDGYREGFEAFDTALDRLATLDVERVYPGHGPVHDELEAAVARDRRSLDDRLERVQELVAEGVSTVPGVAGRLAGDRDVRYLLPEAMSALAHLEDRGAVDAAAADGVRSDVA